MHGLFPEEGGDALGAVHEGAMVVVYERFDCMKAATVTAKGQYNSKWGNFAMKDWIGLPYGSRVQARGGGGWAYLLAPTPQLWTTVLRHRTQILYLADIAMICHALELRPGAVVLESGTGSGSLTTSLARAVAPAGRVHSFEFHLPRADTAREEFAKNGLGGLVTVVHRNVEQDGFLDSLRSSADAVFLDLPGPWKAVPSAAACLRPDGMFCSFSPCIEQVQRTCGALNANGFRDMKTVEILLREYDVSSQPAAADVDALLAAQGTQAAAAQRRRAAHAANGGGGAEPAGKRQRPGEAAAAAADAAGEQQQAGQEEGGAMAVEGGAAAARPAGAAQPRGRVVARPVAQGRGHTGYLTFARKAVPV